MDWAEKVVLVTGGANGIGKAICEVFLAVGATVIIADIDEKTGKAVAGDWKQQNYKAVFYKIDLMDVLATRTMFADMVKAHGKIDVLVNNAGKGIFKPLQELTIEEWDEVIQLNLRAAFVTSQEYAKYHEPNRYGRIINIASTRYLMSEPNSEAYAASKGGIVSLTHALALSLSAERMTVNAVSPGWIENNHYEGLRALDHAQHPAKRVGKPADIANACLFLADEANDFLTGQNIVIDGGMTKKMIYVE